MKKEQYGKEISYSDAVGNGDCILRYYLTESNVGEGYSDIKCYGVEIDKIERKPGMRDIKECKLIDGVFFDLDAALNFLSRIKSSRIEPVELKAELEKFVCESIKKTRMKASAGF